LKAFNQARGIYFPDPQKATAGIHVMNVLKSLGLDQTKEKDLRIFPNGATAMAAMAASTEAGSIGSTQVTEIIITPGVRLIGMLPKEFELATDYCLGICTTAQNPELALTFASILTSEDAASLRQKLGFELA
jgi:molybdate transport system substrate-binding protein